MLPRTAFLTAVACRVGVLSLLTSLAFTPYRPPSVSSSATLTEYLSAPHVPLDGADKSASGQPGPIAYGKLPLSFEPNQGQADASVGLGCARQWLHAAADRQQGALGLASPRTSESSQTSFHTTAAAASVGLRLIDAATAPPAVGQDPLPGTANYFEGSDPALWHTAIPTYGAVRYGGIYPGVDLVYHGEQGRLEYDFVLAPRADLTSIRLIMDGTAQPELTAEGDLVLHTSVAEIRQPRPVLYQEHDGVRQLIDGGYVLGNRQEVSFWVCAYDPNVPLTIDPVLVYSTFLGGSLGFEIGKSIAVDAAGNAYVTGVGFSPNFPTTPGAYQRTGGGAFVTKLNPTGSGLAYSTFVGTSNSAVAGGYSIALDDVGNAYIAGRTDSTNFPTTPGAVQRTFGGGFSDGFVTKLNPSGSGLVYSTFVGGSGDNDRAAGIAVDGSGNAYVTGTTNSADFPTTPGAFPRKSSGIDEAFVTKLNPTGAAMVYSTTLSGSTFVQGDAIALDKSGNAYITGLTFAADLPTTPGAFQRTFGGNASAAFTVKISPGHQRAR